MSIDIKRTEFAKTLFALSENVDFANSKVKSHPVEIDRQEIFDFFITKSELKDNVSIELSSLVGSSHFSYVGLTWFEMLNSLNRRRLNVDVLDDDVHAHINLDFYKDSNKFKNHGDEEPYVKFYNGEGYISTAQHRFCIAKFFSACGLIPNKSVGPSGAKFIEYNEKLIRTYLKIYDSFQALQLKSYQPSNGTSKLKIFNISLEEGKVKGNPNYIIHCKNRLDGRPQKIYSDNINDFLIKYEKNLYYPEEQMLSGLKRRMKKIKAKLF